MEATGIRAERNRPEPTGFEYSVANFLSLPCPFWKTVSKSATPSCWRWKSSEKHFSYYTASQARSKKPGIWYTLFRMADCVETCAWEERISPESCRWLWSLTWNNQAHHSQEEDRLKWEYREHCEKRTWIWWWRSKMSRSSSSYSLSCFSWGRIFLPYTHVEYIG